MLFPSTVNVIIKDYIMAIWDDVYSLWRQKRLVERTEKSRAPRINNENRAMREQLMQNE